MNVLNIDQKAKAVLACQSNLSNVKILRDHWKGHDINISRGTSMAYIVRATSSVATQILDLIEMNARSRLAHAETELQEAMQAALQEEKPDELR